MSNDTKPVGFKEWEVVCRALAEGRQSLIIRKGGIAEGRKGFRFEHPEFYLFPTRFHEQLDRIRVPFELRKLPEGVVEVDLFAQVIWSRSITDPGLLPALEPFHIWTAETVRERFEYGKAPGIEVALLRIHQLSSPWSFPDSPRFGGCRSWVELPPAPPEADAREPVLDDAAFNALEQRLRQLVEP